MKKNKIHTKKRKRNEEKNLLGVEHFRLKKTDFFFSLLLFVQRT